jgi:hypothetical protein
MAMPHLLTDGSNLHGDECLIDREVPSFKRDED